MKQVNKRRTGFVLIEAMIALLIIAFGLVAISRLQVLSIFGSGDAKARSEAMAYSQVKIETLRNMVEKSKFTGTPLVSSSSPERHEGTYAVYQTTWTVTTPSGGLEQRLLQLTTTWKDSQGVDRSINLNSVIAWDDPSLQAAGSKGIGGSLISPTGAAQRLSKTIPGHTGVYTDGERNTYLLDAQGNVLLYIPPKNGEAQSFTTITGKIFFDQNAGNNKIPSSANVRVRLSSEGECVYNNAANSMTSVSGGSNSYKYFVYTCYVGPGWYGNVGVLVDESVNGAAGDPTICVGDPEFNNGVSDSTLISAHPLESASRSYRGFKGSSGNYLSTGVAGGSTYGLSYDTSGAAITGPFAGRPRPSSYSTYPNTVAAGTANDYFEQNFLITSISGNDSCKSKMTGGVFARNAGKYFCINPDNDSATDACPSIWPGFESQVGSGGSINYSLTVTTSGSGTVTSSPSGIDCGNSCSASFASGTTVTLTAAPGTGATFTGWTGCTTSVGTSCTVVLTGATTVTAAFATTPVSDTLTVTPAGTGSGTVTSSPAGIACGLTCSASFTADTQVTLTALANTGSTFTGWSGAGCSGTGSCTVTVSGATSVTATFAADTVYTLSYTKAGTGSGTVSSSPSGINACSANCSASFGAGSTVTLTAAAVAGSTFTGWSGACTGTGACTVIMSAAASVTATFTTNANCTTPISGTAYNSQGEVTASAGGSCAMGNGNVSTYSCSLSLPSGTVVTLTNSKTNGNAASHYSYSKTITANCAAQTNVNFP